MVAPVENPQGSNLFQQTQETGPDYTNIIRWLGLDLVGQQNSQTNFISVFLIDARLQQMSDELQSSEPDLTAEYGVRSVGFRTNMARWIRARQQARHDDIFILSEHPPPPAPISDSIVMVPTTMEGLYLPAHAGSGQFCTVAIREGAGATDDDFDSESEPENLGN
ncbi:hypothetical protein MJO29_017061 [Puccinia striiformis f. sp. tritici]|nr:hypothetical protein MJO29_017061 [Puccinia striiformis f. sp. tritici]